jgi:hypothetical protein
MHLGVVADQDGPLVVPNQFNQRFAFAISEDAEKHELQSSGDSQLGLPHVLHGRRFVDEQLYLIGKAAE